MKHQPTEEQQSIIEAVAGRESVMVEAGAGCAKSSTQEMAAPQVKVPALGLAFNRNIAAEMKPRMPGNFEIKTFNGLGFGAALRALPQGCPKATVEEKKLGKLVSQLVRSRDLDVSGEQWDALRRLVTGAMQVGITPGDRGRPLRADTREAWAEVAEDLMIPGEDFEYLYETAHDILVESIKLVETRGIFSFDDQVYYSTCISGQFPQFPVVFGDEVQDLNPLNHRMLELSVRPDGKMFLVGDPKQCHPPGTLIHRTGKEPIEIENLREGEQLVSFSSQKTYFPGTNTQGRRVTKKVEQQFNGRLVKITADKYSHRVTPNHRCLVRFNSGDFYCIYIMQKGYRFRMGIAQARYTNGFGPTYRARSEGADALWIVMTVQTKEQALVWEKVLCAKYGLPDLMFMNNGEACTNQHLLDQAWNEIGPNGIRAKKCLADNGRDIDFPIWEAEGEGDHIGLYSFITQACNLIDGYMSVKIFDGDERNSDWVPITLDYEEYNGPVYGIEVQPAENGRHLYVANGIVTHNSLYAFRGAVTDGMQRLRALRPNWADRSLLTTFRCPKAVVARQQHHVPGYKAWHTNAEGQVLRLRAGEHFELGGGWDWGVVERLKPAPSAKVMVLCRNNGPLLSLAFKLIRSQIGVTMLGRDIGKGLVALSRKLLAKDDIPLDVCIGRVRDWMESETSLAIANGHEEKCEGITDRGECLLAVLSSGCRDSGELRGMLERLFSRENGQVELGSIHRAKGMERDVILHLDPWRIPSRWAKKAAERGDMEPLKQEWNARYVAETRTRHTLIEANLEDFNG